VGNPATLNFDYVVVAYGDPSQTSNPRLKYVDWTQHLDGNSVQNSKSEGFTIPAGTQQTLFSGTRATTLDGTTAFGMTLSPLNNTTYRFTWTGGTNPSLRTNRSLVLSGLVVTVMALSNGTATFTIPGGGTFSVLSAGDNVFIPGVSTGDTAGPFNPMNEGLWVVLSVTALSITMTRPAGQTFSAVSEVVTQTSNTNMVGYSSSGVQIGDGVDISAGFPLTTLKAYKLLTVTPTFFEVSSTVALPLTTGALPGAAGMVFYSFAKRFILIEVDQEASVQLNGDSGSTNRVSPWRPAEPLAVGTFSKTGPAWSVAVTNRSTTDMNLLLISAE
jgi:hypothetical protein